MPAQARRFQPTAAQVIEDVRVSADETIEARIKRVLDEEIVTDDATHIVRPMCIIATMFLSGLAVEQPVIEVACPHDELRRSQVAPSLLISGTNRVSLYPLREEAYSAFADHMERVGQEFGEYALFTRSAHGGWQMQAFC